MKMSQIPGPVSPEKAPQPTFKITLMRHEEPFYKNEGHDLTERGVAGAIATGTEMREERISENDEMYLLYSPKPRTRGTLDFVAEAAGLADTPRRSIDAIRQSDIPDHERLLKEMPHLGHDQEKWAEAHYKDSRFENEPELIEPHSKKRERLYRAFEYLLRWLDKHPQEDAKTPHILAVSHFEIITHLINDVFGIESTGKYISPSFGEVVNIEGFPSDNPELVSIKVTYGSQSKMVNFNRGTRSIEIE